MRIRNLILSVFLPVAGIINSGYSYELFDRDMPVQNGVNVFEVSSVFTDIYKNLNSVSWAGKDISIAIESLEKMSKDAHIAATDERVILVWRDTIVANYPRPRADDFDGFGQITTALVLKMREMDPIFGNMSTQQMYKSVVDVAVRSIDENGEYVYADDAMPDSKILTSVGIQGEKDDKGNFRVHAVFQGSPADVAGIEDADLITKINGGDVSQMSDMDIENAFSGFNSGTLKLGLLKSSGEKNIVLRRAAIVLADADIIYKQIQSDDKIDNAILEIVVHKITPSSVDIVSEALGKYENISGIVLDMRAASGDDATSAAKLAGLFIGQNPVMRIVETAKSESEIIPGGSAVIEVPTIVLISNATTGSAEAVASAFYESRRGVLVGTPTAGRARMATNLKLKNGGKLILFNKAIKTGSGRDIEGRGIFPLVCLSNIRNDQQQGAFFVNVLNGDFKLQDFNNKLDVPTADIRKGCPTITSGEDEDLLSAGVSVKILTDKNIYNNLLGE